MPSIIKPPHQSLQRPFNIQKFLPIMLWPMEVSLLWHTDPCPLERFNKSPHPWTADSSNTCHSRCPCRITQCSSRYASFLGHGMLSCWATGATCQRFITYHQDGALQDSTEQSRYVSLNSCSVSTHIQMEENTSLWWSTAQSVLHCPSQLSLTKKLLLTVSDRMGQQWKTRLLLMLFEWWESGSKKQTFQAGNRQQKKTFHTTETQNYSKDNVSAQLHSNSKESTQNTARFSCIAGSSLPFTMTLKIEIPETI